MAPFQLFHNGTTFLHQSITAQFQCPVDANRFPFDEHLCMVEIGPWTSNINQCDIRGYNFYETVHRSFKIGLHISR